MTIPAKVRALGLMRQRTGLRSTSFIAASAILFLIVVATLLGPLVYPISPNSSNLGAALAGASPAHPLGTDATGRDVLARVLHGGRETLLAPLVATAFATVIGMAIGVTAAWRGGWPQAVIQRGMDAIFAFPSILLAILFVTIMGRGVAPATAAISIAFIPFIGQLALNITLQEAKKAYVDAYRVLGFSDLHIAARRVIPNIAPLILSQSAVYYGYGIMVLGSISYLGFGVQPPSADWGRLITEGQTALLQGAFLPSLVPGFCMVVTVVCVSIVGETLADKIARRRDR